MTYDEWKTTDPRDREEDLSLTYRVQRFLGPTLVKSYGPCDRDTADWIARRAAEKHPRCTVVVEEER